MARETDFYGRNRAQQEAAALPVLVGAFRALAAEGWCRPYSPEDLGNSEPPPGLGLIEAIQGAGPNPCGIECWYARRLLQRLEGDLLRWERHPARTQEEVLRLLAKAIGRAGGVAPVVEAPRPARRGGWRISMGGGW